MNTARTNTMWPSRNQTERGQPCPRVSSLPRILADKAVRVPNKSTRHRSVLAACSALTMVMVLLWPAGAGAQLTTVTEAGPQACFGGRSNAIMVKFHNPGMEAAEADVQMQLYQASSATRAASGERSNWKRLRVMPGQTVLESAEVGIPAVKAETPFVLAWLDAAGRKLGESDLAVYPTNLLDLLTNLGGGKAIGIFDVSRQIQQALQKYNLPFDDFRDAGFAGFAGKLAVVAETGAADESENLSARVETLANSGVAVVWVQAPLQHRSPLEPALSAAPFGSGAIATVPARTVADLADMPLAQLNLVQAAKMSLSSARGLLYREKP